LLGAYKLSNSVNVVKLRSQYGMYGPEWTGAYNDADPVWATITASSKTSVGYVNNINDGVFFMTVTDFKA
jgi:hypothetical protein